MVALIVALGGFLMGFDASVISGVVGFIEARLRAIQNSARLVGSVADFNCDTRHDGGGSVERSHRSSASAKNCRGVVCRIRRRVGCSAQFSHVS